MVFEVPEICKCKFENFGNFFNMMLKSEITVWIFCSEIKMSGSVYDFVVLAKNMATVLEELSCK